MRCPGSILVLLAIVVTRAAGAQPATPSMPGLDPNKRISQYVVERWQPEQGLPQRTVWALAQTADGYLWIGTQLGLARFDGVRFTLLSPTNTPGLRDKHIRALLLDRSGSVWIGTGIGGVSRLQKGTVTAIESPMPAPLVDAIFEDRRGVIWVATSNGLARVENGRLEPVPGTDRAVHAIAETADGTLLIGTADGVLSWRDGRAVRWHPPGTRIDGPVSSILDDGAGRIWIATPDTLFRSARGRVQRIPVATSVADNAWTTLHRTRNGQVWIGTSAAGVARLGPRGVEHFGRTDGLEGDNVVAMHEDREGSLWIGTSDGGLSRLREPVFTVDGGPNNELARGLWSVYVDADSTVWAGTMRDGLFRMRNGVVARVEGPNGLPGKSILSMLRARDGTLWVGAETGISRLRGDRWEPFTPVKIDRVYVIYEDRGGAIWIGSKSGLLRYAANELRSFTKEAGITARVWAIREDAAGSLWFGTTGNGVLRYRDGRFTRFGVKQGLSHDVVESIRADEAGLWVGSREGGLDLIRNDRVTRLPVLEAGLADLFHISQDALGNIWLGSSGGVASIPKRQLLDAANGRRSRVDIRRYGPLDGLSRIELNGAGQNAGARGPDGRIWFATDRGIASVDLARHATNRLPPPVHIERLVVNGRDVPITGSILVPPGAGTVEVHYSATSLLVPARVRFRYRLEGYDDKWIEAADRRVAYYTGVKGGQYRFRVTAVNDAGVWATTEASLGFRVRPRFVETIWFRMLTTLVAVALLFAAYRWRMQMARRRAAELTALIDQRTTALREEVSHRRRVEERYRHLFDANPQPVWVNDRETLRFLAVNDSAVRHYGFERSEFAEMSLHDLQSPQEGEALPQWIRAAGDGWRGTSLWRQRKKDGTEIDVEVAAHAIVFEGRPAALVVAADVTARRDLEERLRHAQKLEAVGQLAGGIAHDLNNVLTAVMSHVDLAVTSLPPTADVLQDLTQAQKAAHRGATMIRKLLGFSRRERLVRKPLNLGPLTDELTTTIRRMLPAHIDVVVRCAEGVPPIDADAGAVQQVVLNLATNARDAMPEGGRMIVEVSSTELSESHQVLHGWGAPGRYVTLTVTDDGSGMDAATLARIFEPYFSTKPDGLGSGLGMAMVYGLMRQHEGHVQVDSIVGRGTTVRLLFPVSAQEVTASLPDDRRASGSSGQTILVIEDEEAVRSAACRALRRAGYEVLAAADGAEGLELWRARRDDIDLVLSDAVMPRMGGLALLSALRDEQADVRFLLTSGYSAEEASAGAHACVDVPFLSKPWRVSDLLARVRELLEPAVVAD